MKKTLGIILGLIIAIALIVGALTLAAGRWATVDRFNPLLQESTHFVAAEAGQREMREVRAVAADGEELDYPLTFTAYGQDEAAVIEVHHRGAHVDGLDYLEPGEVPAPAARALDVGEGR